LPGVGLVSISGGQKPAVRIQANPMALSSYHLNLEDLRAAISAANVNQAKGNFDGLRNSYTIGANDQILSIGGATEELQPLRLGVSTTFVDQFLHNWQSPDQIRHVSIVCNHTAELSKSLMDGYLDVACLINPSDDVGKYAFGWQENVVWARARDFVLRPGSPIPLIAWAGTQLDAAVIRTLEQAGLTYRCVFSSSDHYARVSAVAAGLGLTALRERQVVAPLVIAREYYLPPLAPVRAKVFVRDGVDINAAEAVIDALKALAPAPARTKSSHDADLAQPIATT